MKRDPSNSTLLPERPARPLAAPVNDVTVREQAHMRLPLKAGPVGLGVWFKVVGAWPNSLKNSM